jgi:large subunit ribosomal protein L25
MAQIVQLAAEPREGRRKTAAKALRSAGKVPAVLYGHGKETRAIAVGGVQLERLLEEITPASTIVELGLGGHQVKALIREIQRHPIYPGILHVDFQEVLAGEKLRLEIPVHLVGIPEGVRNQGGVLDQVLRTVEVEVLPADIPERVELDVTALLIGRSLHVSDLKIPKVTILNDAALTVATVVAPRIEEAPVVAAAAVEGEAGVVAPEAVAEPEVIKKGKVEEAEEGAEE